MVLEICDIAAKATDGSETTATEPTGTTPPKPPGKCRRMQFELDATLDNPAVLDKLRSMIHSRESERSGSEADYSDCCSTTMGPMTEDSDGADSSSDGADILQLTAESHNPLDGEYASDNDGDDGDCHDPSGLSHSNSTIVSSQLSNQSPVACESSNTVVDDTLVAQSLSLDESAASLDDVALVARHVEQMTTTGEEETSVLSRAVSIEAKAIATVPLTFGEYDFPLIHESYLEGESWRKGPLLGTGAFSSCYLGFDTATGQLMAVKQLALANNSAEEEQRILDKIAHEINLMRLFAAIYYIHFSFEMALLNRLEPHPNVVNYYGAVQEENHFNIFLEHMAGGSLSSLLKKFGAFPEQVVRRITKQLVLGLRHLHRNGIMHRDLKGGNIIVDQSGRSAKLCDCE